MCQIHRDSQGFDSVSSVLIFPNTCNVAFSSLGFLKVFSLLSKLTNPCDISYLPENRSRLVSKSKGILLSLLSKVEVNRFDMVCFSIAYENDFPNVVKLLAMARIAPLASERRDRFPLVVFGGFTMFSNPLPVADFADAIVIGEAEPVLPSLVEVVSNAKRLNWSKPKMLEKLSEIDGVFVPSITDSNVRRVWATTDRISDEVAQIGNSHFGSMFLLEVGRGCRRGCLFCSPGRLYLPVRERSLKDLVAQTRKQERIGLLGTAVGDRIDLVELLREIVQQGKQVSISSLRPDNITFEIASLLARGGLKSVAIAPETGSDSLRYRIGKPIARQTIYESVRLLSQAGLSSIKLYFMIGLPTETLDDIRAIVDLVGELARIRGRSRLIVGVSPFVPKPHTPLQWAQVAPRQYLKAAMEIVSDLARIQGCMLRSASINQALTEALLSRSDKGLSNLLLECGLRGASILTATRRKGLEQVFKQIDLDSELPWDFIDNHTPKHLLVEQYRRFIGAI